MSTMADIAGVPLAAQAELSTRQQHVFDGGGHGFNVRNPQHIGLGGLLCHCHNHDWRAQELVTFLSEHSLCFFGRIFREAPGQGVGHDLSKFCTSITSEHNELPWFNFMMVGGMGCSL